MLGRWPHICIFIYPILLISVFVVEGVAGAELSRVPPVRIILPTALSPVQISTNGHVLVTLEIDSQVALADISLFLWSDNEERAETYAVVKPAGNLAASGSSIHTLEIRLDEVLASGLYDLELVAEVYGRNDQSEIDGLYKQYEQQAVHIEDMLTQAAPLNDTSRALLPLAIHGELEIGNQLFPKSSYIPGVELVSLRAAQINAGNATIASLGFTPEGSFFSYVKQVSHSSTQISIRATPEDITQASLRYNSGPNDFMLGTYSPALADSTPSLTKLHLRGASLIGGYGVTTADHLRTSVIFGQKATGLHPCASCNPFYMADVTVIGSPIFSLGAYALGAKGLIADQLEGSTGIHLSLVPKKSVNLYYEQALSWDKNWQPLPGLAHLFSARLGEGRNTLTAEIYSINDAAYIHEPTTRRAGQAGYELALSRVLHPGGTGLLGYKQYVMPIDQQQKTNISVKEASGGYRLAIGNAALLGQYTQRQTRTSAATYAKDQVLSAFTLSGWAPLGLSELTGRWQHSITQSEYAPPHAPQQIVFSSDQGEFSIATTWNGWTYEIGFDGEMERTQAIGNESQSGGFELWTSLAYEAQWPIGITITTHLPYEIESQGIHPQSQLIEWRIDYALNAMHSITVNGAADIKTQFSVNEVGLTYRLHW